MIDESAERPASKADLERLSAESAGRAQVLHDELLRELHRRFGRLEETMAEIVQAEVAHGGRFQRGELRLLRQELAGQGATLSRLERALDRRRGRSERMTVAVLLAATVVTVLLIAAVTVSVTG